MHEVGAVPGEESRGVMPDHAPVADGDQLRRGIQPIDLQMREDADDVVRTARVFDVEEDAAALLGTRPGGRWRREEDEELVAAVRAGADLAVIAEQRGRTRVPSCRGCSG